MEQGYGKRQLIIEVTADLDSLVNRLLDISEKAGALAAQSRALMLDLKQEQYSANCTAPSEDD